MQDIYIHLIWIIHIYSWYEGYICRYRYIIHSSSDTCSASLKNLGYSLGYSFLRCWGGKCLVWCQAHMMTGLYLFLSLLQGGTSILMVSFNSGRNAGNKSYLGKCLFLAQACLPSVLCLLQCICPLWDSGPKNRFLLVHGWPVSHPILDVHLISYVLTYLTLVRKFLMGRGVVWLYK